MALFIFCYFIIYNFVKFSDLRKPTESCNTDEKFKVITIIIGAVLIVTVVVIVTVCLYKICKAHQRTKRRNAMPDTEKQRHEDKINELHQELLKALKDESLDERRRDIYVKEIKKSLDFNRGLLQGDGSNKDLAIKH